MKVLVLLFIVVLVSVVMVDNFIIQIIYFIDLVLFVYNGCVYFYIGYDEFGLIIFVMKDWCVFFLVDMVNWQDYGLFMSLVIFSWVDVNVWVGQMIQCNGKFYWYVLMCC